MKKNEKLITYLREQVGDTRAPITSDEEFLLKAETVGLLCGLTDGALPPPFGQYLLEKDNPSELMITGLHGVRDIYEETAGDGLSLFVTVVQEWDLLATAVADTLRTYNVYLSPRFWQLLRDLKNLAHTMYLTQGAADAIVQWRRHTKLAKKHQIATVRYPLSDAEKYIASVVYEEVKRKE